MPRKMMVRPAALLVLLALLAALLPPRTLAAGEVYFTAVNDNLLPLSQETMPVWSGGTLYVPYTVFSAANGLSVYGSHSAAQETVTLYNLQQILVFDLKNGTCRNDLTGESLDARAITRSGRAYVPVRAVCDFFGLTYTYSAVPQGGYLVRVCSSAVVLTDEQFIDAAQELFKRRLREYNQSSGQTGGGESDGGDPAPVVPDPAPDPGEDTPPEDAPEAVYLAFRCETGEGLAGILDALDASGHCAVFFLTRAQLEGQQDLVRRMVGSGHSVGLLAEEGDAAATRLELERSNELLTRIAHLRTTLAMVPDGQQKGLEELGWVCWQETLYAQPRAGQSAVSFSSQVADNLAGKNRAVCLTLPDSALCATLLPTLLRTLSGSQLVVTVPRETVL